MINDNNMHKEQLLPLDASLFNCFELNIVSDLVWKTVFQKIFVPFFLVAVKVFPPKDLVNTAKVNDPTIS